MPAKKDISRKALKQFLAFQTAKLRGNISLWVGIDYLRKDHVLFCPLRKLQEREAEQ